MRTMSEHPWKLAEATKRLGDAADQVDIIETLRQYARRASGADGIAVICREGAMVTYVAEDALGRLWTGQRFVIRHCISGLAILERAPILIPDTLADPRVPQAVYAATFVRGMAMFPIGAPEPSMALGGYWAKPNALDPAALEMLEELAALATQALKRIALSMPGARLAG
ncbi:GAF domain-containing protein [Sphingomonas sp. MMS12-HWE2-04]|uniref:GAF domain-containing protein n=1 Tax=Sphingomonas sp. MMS12-HWE2-04 TaxID=3234199 RepID=UPI00384E69FE